MGPIDSPAEFPGKRHGKVIAGNQLIPAPSMHLPLFLPLERPVTLIAIITYSHLSIDMILFQEAMYLKIHGRASRYSKSPNRVMKYHDVRSLL